MALALTLNVTGTSDVNRLRRELQGLQDFFHQAAARNPGASLAPPRTTQQLDDLAKLNKISLLKSEERTKLAKQLDDILVKAPKLRIAFAVDPPPRVLQSILDWLRTNLDPYILLQVGLQPNIGAGCVLRTANREFDMSMRQHLIDSRPYLTELIATAAKKTLAAHEVNVTTQAPAPQQSSPSPPASNPHAPPPQGLVNG